MLILSLKKLYILYIKNIYIFSDNADIYLADCFYAEVSKGGQMSSVYRKVI